MPTDLQVIDGFEALRAEFLEANPGAGVATEAPAPDRPRAETRHAVARALEAWLRAVASLEGRSGHQSRWLRALVRRSLDGAPANGAEALDDPGFKSLLAKRPTLLEDARDAADRLASAADAQGRAGVEGPFASLAEEAAAWARMLPSLGGLRAWRFLHHLGRPVLVPESNTRRFLWRLGLVEDGAGRGGRDAAKVMDAVERIARLTGGDLVEVDRLIRWHTRSQTGLAGGGRCSTHPSCEGCAFEAACLWRRFHGATDRVAREGEPGEAEVERIKRRWRELGPEALEDVELLALLLHGGRDGRNPIELAESLLRRFEGLRGVDLGSEAELTDVRGVGESRARAVKVALELGRRASLNPLRPGEAVNGSGDVWRAYRGRYRHIPQEHFITLLLDTKNRLIATHLVSKGTLSASPAHPREVFKEAVRRSASGVILMHNHPTGDPEPSADDLALTRQLVESARILGIRVLDHIILGSETYYSFRDSGLV